MKINDFDIRRLEYILNNLKIGDVLHCEGNGLVASGIKAFTKNKMQHRSLTKITPTHTAGFTESWFVKQITDSQKDGFNPREFFKWYAKYGYDFVVTRPTNKDFDPIAFAHRATLIQGTTGYDFENLIFRQPWRLLTGNFKIKENESEKMVCSESIAYCHNHPIYMSPIEYFDYCIETAKHEIIFQFQKTK